jgi:hypothetical protein
MSRMKGIPRPCLVDTNVAIVANGRSEQADDSMVEKCIDAILEVTGKGGLVLDDGGLIFTEYRENLSLRGQPGTGDAFVKWVHDHQWNPAFCERWTITSLKGQERDFVEFPKAKSLSKFDPGDRKFVAVANAAEPKRPIIQAVDFKWWGWKDALAEVGIRVVFLDEAAAEAGYRRHVGDA